MPVDLTSLLKDWGVTITFLSVAATALLVIFTLSFREFASWFMRINQVIQNQVTILEKLNKLESLAERAEFEKSPEIKLSVLPSEPTVVVAPKERFQLHS